MTEQEFHANRQMFAVRDATVLVAPFGYPYSHRGWLQHVLGCKQAGFWLEHHLRGYVYQDKIAVYVTSLFSHRVNQIDAQAALAVMEKLHTLTTIGFGVDMATGDYPWAPKTVYSIEEYKARMNNQSLPEKEPV